MTKSDLEEFENVVDEALPEPEEEDHPEPLWDGRSSKVSLAYPIQRHFEIVGPGEPCIDCKKSGKPDVTGHQFHIRASRTSKGGPWGGPEAAHLDFLRENGYLRSTAQAAERQAKQADRDRVFGVEPSAVCRRPACALPIPRNENGRYAATCPACGSVNGLPELRAWTARDLRRVTDRDLRQGAEGAQAIEKALLRDEIGTGKMRETAGEMGKSIADAILEGMKEGRK